MLSLSPGQGPFLVLVGSKRTLFGSKEAIYAKNVKFRDFC